MKSWNFYLNTRWPVLSGAGGKITTAATVSAVCEVPCSLLHSDSDPLAYSSHQLVVLPRVATPGFQRRVLSSNVENRESTV